jgi:predicted RNase H-like nuclease (RuvC/YqgF family)
VAKITIFLFPAVCLLMKSNPSPPEDSQEPDFEEELTELERSLTILKDRYAQVQRDQQQKALWQHEIKELKQNRNQSPEIKAELKRLQGQLEAIEINLESQLFSWNSLKRPFWQAVRFGGMGIIIGWLLKSSVG